MRGSPRGIAILTRPRRSPLLALSVFILLVAACSPLTPADPTPDIDWSDPEVGGGVGLEAGPEMLVATAAPIRDTSPRLDAAAQATAAVGHPAVPPTAAPAATTESIPATEPPPEPVAPTADAPPEPTADSDPVGTGETIHVVQPGENLYQIGLLYGLTWQAIAEYNGITNPDAIDVGQELKIPGN